MLKPKLTRFLTFVLILLLLTLNVAPVFSQENSKRHSALAVSPAVIELVLEPGEKEETKVAVFNITNFPLPVKASVKSFVTVKEEELKGKEKDIFDASSWFTLDEADFILQPNQRREVEITVTAPDEAEPGGHYATVYFQPLVPVEVLSPQTVYLSARVGVLAFLVVRGEIKEDAGIGGLQTENFRQFGPVEFKLPFKNQGNVHLLPAGKVKIYDFRGLEVAKLDLKPQIVLPKQEREFKLIWDKKYPIGRFSANGKVKYGSDQKELETNTVYFWVFPWMPILGTIFVLALLILFVVKVRDRFVLALRVLIGKEPPFAKATEGQVPFAATSPRLRGATEGLGKEKKLKKKPKKKEKEPKRRLKRKKRGKKQEFDIKRLKVR